MGMLPGVLRSRCPVPVMLSLCSASRHHLRRSACVLPTLAGPSSGSHLSSHGRAYFSKKPAPKKAAPIESEDPAIIAAAKFAQKEVLINEKIPFKHVSLAVGDKLNDPVPLTTLLDSLKDPVGTLGEDGKKIKGPTHYIQLVSLDPPVVRLFSRAEAYAKKKETAKKQKASSKSNVTKEIQLTWGVAKGDWDHKVSKARLELKKGNRVEVVFAPKSKVKPPSQDEMLAIANKMVESLRDVGVQWKDPKRTSSMLLIHIRPRTDSDPAEVEPSSDSPPLS